MQKCIYCLFRRMVLLFAILFPSAINARDFKDFHVQHFGDESLPQLTIMDLHADRDGYLWICTQMGLVRFDGQQFRVFTPDNTPALKNVRCNAFVTDQQGVIYLIDGVGNLYKIFRDGPKPVSWKGLETAHNYVYPTGRSPIWRASFTKNGKAFKYIEKWGEGHSSYQLVLDKDSINYHLYNPNRIRPKSFLWNGELIIIQPGFQLTLLKPGNKPTHDIKLTGDILPHQNSDEHIFNKSRVLNDAGNLWYYFDSTIYRLDFNGHELHTTMAISHINLPGEIKTFYFDKRNGYCAVGTSSEGLYMLYPNSFSTKTLSTGPSSNIFYAVEHVRDNLYFTSSGYVFDLYKNYDRQVTKKMAPFALFRQGKDIWFSSPGSMNRLNVDAGVPNHYLDMDGSKGWFQRGLTDRWGRVWIATNARVARYSDGKLEWLSVFNNRKDNYYIENIWFADSNVLWLGLRDGLYTYNLVTEKCTRVPEMSGMYVRNFIDDGTSGAWILTYGNGYYHYGNSKFTKMPLDRNNRLMTVHTMLLDANGYYWMTTNKGLFRVNRQRLLSHVRDTTIAFRYEYFDKQYGFSTNEFNGGSNPCGNIISDSLFLLPTMSGLVYFNPLKVLTSPQDNDLFLDELEVDNKPYPISKKLLLPTDFSSFRGRISTPYFGLKENLVLEYKIEGLTENWEPLIDNKYIQFNRLPYGKYTIRIRKLTSFDADTTKEISIPFQVITPWYFRTWFLVLLSLFAVAFIWFLFQLRLRLLTRQKHKLEGQVEERTRQLASSLEQLKMTIDSLEQSQTELHSINRFKEQLTSIVLHDIQTPLRFLKRVMKHIFETHKTLSPDVLNSELEEVYHSTSDVAAYSEDFLIWIKSQKDAFVVVNKQVDVCSLLHEIGNLYHKIAANAGTMIDISCPVDILLRTDPALLSIIIRNLTDNAIKFTTNGRIQIAAEVVENTVRIHVRDNGIGMNAAQLEHIMVEHDTQEMIARGQMGYHFIKDLLRMLGGALKIESTPGEGTRVTLLFTTQ